MSEPHELEERAAWAMLSHDNDLRICAGPAPCFLDRSCSCTDKLRPLARAVLNLVRQEQEAESPGLPLMNIRAWWLSHTAKETSNG